ncbi:Glycos_transf_1 domain-containing protein [Rubrivivax sp. A210]|uniref:selenoneine biosynthesis selenosugar synthase SenB n=1 Tax=Rubrivivax sp. A210 TaxID=2772301 RepID=UPI00191834C9|nr:selenoneine biosynthesis selenosugar synthase SenB [Rubrivivax sp. A210]CAD5373645.1 Glycos_transf_1 domain-containing protein [Rubrivivax sp. A210]
MSRPRLVIVTPALRGANNGNWQTAQRWARMLAADYRVALTEHWEGGDEALMIALHARRSAASMRAWREADPAHAARPLLLVLTGTDLYQDILVDDQARQSLALADRLVLLNECAPQALPEALRAKARVCLQSAPALAAGPRPKTGRHLRALMVGHLRAVKSPATYFEAARLLADRPDIRLDHIGGALEGEWALQAQALMAAQPGYRWLGALTHAATRRRIRAAHLLVHPSLLEGGAHVVIEAVRSGTPVLASRIDGNLGLLGAGYPGVFEPGDAAELAALLRRARDDATMLPALQRHCARRAPLFAPERERQVLRGLVAELLHPDFPAGDPR